MPKIALESLVVGEIAVNCYIVENTETQECLIVDPGAEAERIIARVGNRKPAAVLLTHGHYDHIGAVDAVCEHYQIPLYMHALDASKLTDPEMNVSYQFGSPLTQHTTALPLEDGQRITLAGIELEVIHTPGHTAGGVCYRLPDNQGLLTGDTLFAHGYGRTDFADGDFGLLHQSLRILFRLTPKMMFYPGHDCPGIVGREPTEAK